MNKYDFTKEILSQLGKPSSRRNNPVENKVRSTVNPGGGEPKAVTSPKSKGPHLLAVFTGTNRGIDKALKELQQTRNLGITFDIAFSWNGKDLQDIKNIQKQLDARNVFTEVDKGDITKILERVDGIVVPMTTQNTTSKLSRGILDDFISTLLWESLWRGKKMVLNLDSVVEYKGQRSKVPEMEKMVEEMIKKVEKMGVITLYGQEYGRVIENTFLKNSSGGSQKHSHGLSAQVVKEAKEKAGEKTVITDKDLINMNSPSKVLIVPFDAIVTPLAMDRAKTLGIEIKKEQG